MRIFPRRATLVGVSDKEVELYVVNQKPAGQSFSIDLDDLGEFPNDIANLVSTLEISLFDFFWYPRNFLCT